VSRRLVAVFAQVRGDVVARMHIAVTQQRFGRCVDDAPLEWALADGLSQLDQ